MAATMAQFVDMERRHGSLIRGMRRAARAAKRAADATPSAGPAARDVDPGASGARYGLFVAPRLGMSSLVDALAARLATTRLRLNTPVTALERSAAGTWRVTTREDADEFAAVVLALPAPQAAPLAGRLDAELGSRLAAIEYAGAAVVVAAFRREQFAHPLNGFGFVAPIVERRKILSASFANIKFAGRAPDDCVIVRVFIGGACQPELLRLDDAALQQLAWDELGELLGLRGAPQFADVVRWDGRMPQYHVGHLDRVAAIDAQVARLPGLALAGNAYRGVGIPFCVRSGEQAAEAIAKQLLPISAD
jgi:oxygen-dependent protoporphyrinogen oxidase